MTRSAEEMFALDAGYFPKEILRAEREADAPLSEALAIKREQLRGA